MERTRSFLSVNSSLMMRFATAPPSIAMIMRRASSSSSPRLAYFWLSASRKVCTVSTGSGASAMRLLRRVGASSSSHRRLVLVLLLRLLFFFGSWTAAAAADSATPKHDTEDDKEAFVLWPEPLAEALDQLTVCQSGASAPSHMETARRRFASLLRRQRLPMDAASVRALSDVEVSRLLLMAAVGGMDTSWRRSPASSSSAEEETPSKWLIDAHGRLIPAFAPNQVESDVLLCIICALLGALALPRGAL
jgi:hypothetical protein